MSMTKTIQLIIEWVSKLVAMGILLFHSLQTLGFLVTKPTLPIEATINQSLLIQLAILSIIIISLGMCSWYFKERQFLITAIYPLIVLIIVGLILLLELP